MCSSDLHDGSDVNADAVKWSFERLMKIGQGPSEAFPKDMTVTVVDPMTVTFTLKTPFAPFLYTLANDGAGIVNPAIAKPILLMKARRGWRVILPVPALINSIAGRKVSNW